jgi:RimJ/RimL family protein N-acetyltransferase
MKKGLNRSMTVHGEKLTIRPTTEADFPDLLALWNDGRVMKWVGFPNGLGYGQAKVRDWFDNLEANPNRHHFVVHTSEIGFCGEVYYGVEKVHVRASLDIKHFPKAQGQGLATDALRTLIRVVFKSEQQVDAVWTGPSIDNRAARKLYGRCGLREKPIPSNLEGTLSYCELRRSEWEGRSPLIRHSSLE